jgi:hypothetical protein
MNAAEFRVLAKKSGGWAAALHIASDFMRDFLYTQEKADTGFVC